MGSPPPRPWRSLRQHVTAVSAADARPCIRMHDDGTACTCTHPLSPATPGHAAVLQPLRGGAGASVMSVTTRALPCRFDPSVGVLR